MNTGTRGSGVIISRGEGSMNGPKQVHVRLDREKKPGLIKAISLGGADSRDGTMDMTNVPTDNIYKKRSVCAK